jgi:hypothetical protein
MRSPFERILFVQAKLQRARGHLLQLQVLHSAYIDSTPYEVDCRQDPDTRRPVYFIRSIKPPSIELALTAGDVLHNTRSALDHLAYQLVCVGTGHEGPHRNVQFPIGDDAKDYADKRRRWTKGMRPDALAAIDSLKPYKGGNDTLWRLHRLDNVDKHRLVITIGSAYRSVNIGAVTSRLFRKLSPDTAQSIPEFSAFFRPADRLFPLTVGTRVFGGAIDEPCDKVEFRFELAIGEPGVVNGEPLLETLSQMISAADKVLKDFEPLLGFPDTK